MQALILAGGKGTRLNSITKDIIPKPMAIISGKPILEHVICSLKDNGIRDIYISVGFLHEKIEEYFSDGKKWDVDIHYIIETQPLGSGGALFFLKDKVIDDLIICPGDAIFDVNLARMQNFHKSNKALITLFTHPNSHPFDSDLIVSDKTNKVLLIDKKNSTRNYFYSNNVNSGLMVINKATLKFFKELKPINLEHDFVSSFIKTEKVFSYKSPEYIKDVGTPERFFATQDDIQNGIVSAKNLKNKQKAIFLDRDGTINKYKGFISNADQIELLENTSAAIKLINQAGYLAIVVSNQPVIARGEATFEDVDFMFKKIETLLGFDGAYVDAIYYCPHHPHSGYENEVKELKIDCNCRKPKTGMIEKAVETYNIDLKNSYMIGDSNVDIKTANNAGLRCIKLNQSYLDENFMPSYATANSLFEAVKLIVGEKTNEKNN